MFENLSDKFLAVFKKIRGEARLTEENIRDAMSDVRVALLEADVNFKVVKNFTKAITEKAIGQETIKTVRPAEHVIKIVYDELVAMLGGTSSELKIEKGKFTVVMLLGLQGSGKTTFAGKLARYAQKRGAKPMLVACDIYRPAAVHQLEVVGKAVGVPVFQMGTDHPAEEIAKKGIAEAKAKECDLVIVDTAGRLHIDEVKMDELVEVRKAIKPDYSFLVADAMTGQDAVNSAAAFHEGVGVDGVCLTKIDGDARGGAALSIRAVAEKPIFFIGTGEKADDLEAFHPDRIASRILGMGDIVSLVERAQENIAADEALEMQKKMRRQEFNLQDFLDQMSKVKKMGSLSSLMKMIPGMGQLAANMPVDDDAFKPMEAMILSMTPEERESPGLIDGSRKKRIAKGSGTTPQNINEMLREFEQMRKMMGAMMGGGLGGMMRGAKAARNHAKAAAQAAAGEGGDGEAVPATGAPGGMRQRPRHNDDPLGLKNKPKHRRKKAGKKKSKGKGGQG